MIRKSLLVLISGMAALFCAVGQPAMAQDGTYSRPSTSNQTPPATENAVPGQDGEAQERAPRNQRRRREPTPEQNKTAAQGLLTTAGIPCQVTEATLLGETAEKQTTYETICASGPGYLAIVATPPQTFSCLELASTAVVLRERDPNADVGQQCTLPANQNTTAVVAAYAQEAGVPCTVDQGIITGKSDTDNLIYEVGCNGVAGFWMEKTAAGWEKTPCFDLVLQDPTRCRYTTPAEIAATWKAMLANTSAAACDVAQARRVGRDAQALNVYEVKCSSGEGYFTRLTSDNVAQRAQTCAEAANVAGGCTLTTAAPAAAAPAPAAPATTQQ
ncbi:MAG: hypothetical protein EON89_11675 [Brevundimonas sp.]|nr:MAG: hypothetical protein EON89_11675 [Brevundimonas sp.]